MESFLKRISSSVKRTFSSKSEELQSPGASPPSDSDLSKYQDEEDSYGCEEAMDLQSCSCPQFAVKSIKGHRPHMEDTYAVVPAVISVPSAWVMHLQGFPEPGTHTIADSSNKIHGTLSSTETLATESLPAPAWSSLNITATDSMRGGAAAATAPQPTPATSRSVNLGGSCDLHLFAVYDGHGGASVSDHCSKHLHKHLRSAMQCRLEQPPLKQSPFHNSETEAAAGVASAAMDSPSAAPACFVSAATAGEEDSVHCLLFEAFLHVDQELLRAEQANEKGTTAVVVLLGSKHVWVANCGDSRAVLVRGEEVLVLSSDHKASRPDEMIRVEQAGGYIWWNRVMGELAISRAIGDHKLRPYVIAEPEVTRSMRHQLDELLIVASDGLWDVFSSKDACAMAKSKFQEELARAESVQGALKKAASALTKAALSRGSRDNVTVLVVDVRKH